MTSRILPQFDTPLSLLGDSTDLALLVLDRDGRVVRFNPGAERLLGHLAGEVVGRHISVLDGGDRAVAARWMTQAATAGSCDTEGWRLRRDGSPLWLNQISVQLHGDAGEPRGYALVLRDTGERQLHDLALRAAASRLEGLAAADPLTGLRNRREFDRMLQATPRQQFTVLAIDVDHLKRVNDEHGHQAGDVLLQSIAATLAVLVRGWDVLARVGGDEFAALLPGAGPEEAAKIAERMCSAVQGIVLRADRAQISVGWASAPAGTHPQSVMEAADHHLLAAKRAGRDRVVGGEFASEPVLAWGMSSDEVLDEVLSGGALGAVYQPIVDLADGHAIGYEALARPRGFSPRDSVEPLFRAARRTGRIRDLDWRCRRAAIAGVSSLPEGANLHLNVSTTALADPVHDADQLLLLLRSAGWPATRTVLETSAEERITSLSRLAEVLTVYRREGLRFACDGAGQGGSTPEALAALRPEFIKVDGRRTTAAARGAARGAIEATLGFARSTGAVTIAEGVENRISADRLRTLGVRCGQGFRLGRPAPIAAMPRPTSGAA